MIREIIKKKNKAVFIDRDGTLIRDRNYLADPDRIDFYKNSFKTIRLLKKAGYSVIITTNQSGIERGLLSLKQLKKIHAVLRRVLIQHNALIDGIYFCPHTTGRKCSCRKPKIGMAKQAQRERTLDLARSFSIGDKISDVYFAWNFGGKGILVLTGKGRRAYRKLTKKEPNHISPTLYDAARWIIKYDN